jgi:peptidoglycan hydrolase-like protein with peptidoglycan-binding domain
MDPKQPRTLRLAAPHMHGPDVADVQRLLGVDDDGEYGPETARAVANWKRARGVVPASRELDPLERRLLLSDVLLRAVRLMEHWAIAGVGEEPVGSNRVPELVSLAERLDVPPEYSRMGYPWCAFCAFLAALVAGGRTAAFGLRRKAFNPLYVPDLLAGARARKYGLSLVEPEDAFRGDLVLFDWNLTAGDPADHVARLVQAPADGRVRTVDGNSGDAGLVALRERPLRQVRAFARDS